MCLEVQETDTQTRSSAKDPPRTVTLRSSVCTGDRGALCAALFVRVRVSVAGTRSSVHMVSLKVVGVELDDVRLRWRAVGKVVEELGVIV